MIGPRPNTRSRRSNSESWQNSTLLQTHAEDVTIRIEGADEAADALDLDSVKQNKRPPILSPGTSFSPSSSTAENYSPLFYTNTVHKIPGYDSPYFKTPSTAVDSIADASSYPFLPKLDSYNGDGWPGPVSDPDRSASKSFERPDWLRLWLFIILCVSISPFLMLISLIANHKSIWWARFIVGVGSGLLGVGLAVNLLEFAKRHLEASTWATVIHESWREEGGGVPSGIPLRDLARYTTERSSVYSALWLLIDRFVHQSTRRQIRSSNDKRPWSLFILFHLLLVCLCSSLAFIFGRVIAIDSVTVQQNDNFDEVYVWGDLSSKDTKAASDWAATLNEFSQWTLAPFASLTDYPPSVSFKYGNDTVYFAESYASQLREDGIALGTFNLNGTDTLPDLKRSAQLVDSKISAGFSGLVQFAKWGIRIHCELLPDPELNLIAMSKDGFTYIFVPDAFLKTLFANLSIPYPALQYANLTSTLSANDSLPAGVDPKTLPIAAKFFNNGIAHSFYSHPGDEGDSGNGWVEIEVLLVRLNSTFTPRGSFAAYGPPLPDINGVSTSIGYDAAVCVEAYEPWIVETYNSTGVAPSSTRIVSKGGTIDNVDSGPSGAKRMNTLASGNVVVNRTLNSTGKFTPYAVAHDNSIAQMIKDNARDKWYVPSPLTLSFSDGSGPTGYTKLSPVRYAQARAGADSMNVSPFLAGSAALLSRVYPSKVLAVSSVDKAAMIAVNIVILIVGLFAGLCVPRLPYSVPRRGFDLLSWLAVLHGDNMIGQLPVLPGSGSALSEKMALEEVEGAIGDVRVRYRA